MSSPRLGPLIASTFIIGSAEVLAAPMMPEMGRSLGCSSQRIALFPAVYAIVYAVLAPMLGPLSDRHGRKALLVPALLGFAVAMLGVAASPSFGIAMVCCALTGACAAVIQPNTLAVVNDLVPIEKAPVAMGRVFTGLTTSFVVTPVVSSFVATRAHWRIAYVMLAAIALATSMGVARLSIPPIDAPRRTAPLAAIRSALSTYGIPRRLGVTFLWIGSSAGIAAILSEAARRRFGWSAEAAGLFAGFFGLCTVLGNSAVGPLDRWFASRRRMLLAGIVVTAVGCALVGVVPIPWVGVPVLGVILWTFGYGAGGPLHQSLLGHMVVDSRATVAALNASAINLGIAAVTSLASGLLDRIGVPGVFGIAASAMLLGAALLLSITTHAEERGTSDTVPRT